MDMLCPFRFKLFCLNLEIGTEPPERSRKDTELSNTILFYSNFLFILQDLVKSEGGVPKAQRSAVLADVNICWASAFSFKKRTVEIQEREISKAGEFLRQDVSFSNLT